jgi:hypothetical protein
LTTMCSINSMIIGNRDERLRTKHIVGKINPKVKSSRCQGVPSFSLLLVRSQCQTAPFCFVRINPIDRNDSGLPPSRFGGVSCVSGSRHLACRFTDPNKGSCQEEKRTSWRTHRRPALHRLRFRPHRSWTGELYIGCTFFLLAFVASQRFRAHTRTCFAVVPTIAVSPERWRPSTCSSSLHISTDKTRKKEVSRQVGGSSTRAFFFLTWIFLVFAQLFRFH